MKFLALLHVRYDILVHNFLPLNDLFTQKLTVCIENEEKEDVVIIFAEPSERVPMLIYSFYVFSVG